MVTEFEGYKNRNATARSNLLLEGGGDEEMAAATENLSLTTKTWKVTYTEVLLAWCKEEVAKKEGASAQLLKAVQDANSLADHLAEAVVLQRFHMKVPPTGEAVWAATLALDGGTKGRLLFDLLKHDFRPLYKKGAGLGVGPSGGNKDRALTAEVAEIGNIPARHSKGKGKKGKGRGKDKDGGVKRQSPSPERQCVRPRRN